MPTYQYRCSDCGHEFDQYQKFSDLTLTVCPACSGAIRRVIQPVGVVFKGSGWYINDSKKQEKTTGNSAKKAESSTGGTSEPSATPEASASTTEKTGSTDGAEKNDKAAVKEPAPPVKPTTPTKVAASA